MKQKLNCVLLIDDDEPTNFLNEIVIKQTDCTEKCVALQSGRTALEYLTSQKNGSQQHPDLILLDINMPAMNGWEFLDACREHVNGNIGNSVVVMLTTSMNPDDEEKAKTYALVNDFKHKPLTVETIHDIIGKHFPDRL